LLWRIPAPLSLDGLLSHYRRTGGGEFEHLASTDDQVVLGNSFEGFAFDVSVLGEVGWLNDEGNGCFHDLVGENVYEDEDAEDDENDGCKHSNREGKPPPRHRRNGIELHQGCDQSWQADIEQEL
jgi:hypothetical protein